MILLYHRWCTSVNRVRNILKISQSANWQSRENYIPTDFSYGIEKHLKINPGK